MANEIITNRKRSIATSTQISPTRVTMTESNDYGAENSTDADDYSVDIEYDENNPYDIDDHNSSQITTASMVDVASRIRRDVLEQTPLLPLNRNSRNNNNNNYNNNVVNRVSVLVHNITLVSEDENIHPDAQVESLIQKSVILVYYNSMFRNKWLKKYCLSGTHRKSPKPSKIKPKLFIRCL